MLTHGAYFMAALFTFLKVLRNIGFGYGSREYLFQVISDQAMHGFLPSSLALSSYFAGL
jgi:hypothetical protein